jgi:hypothetical protein
MLRRLGITGTIARALRAALAFVLALGTVVIAGAQVGSGVGGVPVTLRIRSLGVNTSPPSVGGVTGTGAITSQLAGDGATVGALESNSAIPQLNFHETDAAANNGHWLCGANGEQFRCRTSVDDGSAVGTWLLVDRTAQTVDSLALSATAITLNGVAASDFARLSAANTFTAVPFTIGAASARIVLNDTSGAQSNWIQFTDNGTATWFLGGDNVAGNLCGGSAANDLCIRATNASARLIYSQNDGVSSIDITPASGTVTASFDDACSTTPTATLDYQRIGNVVVMRVDDLSGFTCTGDSASFRTTGTPLPASIRPAENVVSAIQGGFTNNGTATQACWFIEASGNVSFNVNATSGCAGTWTASGVRSMPTGLLISYPLGNP